MSQMEGLACNGSCENNRPPRYDENKWAVDVVEMVFSRVDVWHQSSSGIGSGAWRALATVSDLIVCLCRPANHNS
jgi:hypothetical protein